MTTHFLPVFVGNALTENVEVLDRGGPGTDWAAVLSFCEKYRIAGIGDMLIAGRAGDFHLRLHQSARAFCEYLRVTKAAEQRTGQSTPFLDAIAAGDLDGAGEIAQRSRHQWMKGLEYEEDFLFIELLMQRYFLGASAEATQALLDRWETCLEGTEDLRLELCRALVAGDAKAFNRTLTLFVTERRREYGELRREKALAPELLATEGYVSVEGVALVRLARQQGLVTERQYAQIPDLTLQQAEVPFSRDSWKSL